MAAAGDKSPALGALAETTDFAALGADMHALAARLYPLCRSATGDGVRETLRIVGERVPLVLTEVPSGAEVYDWTVPREWSIRDAWIKDARGEKVVDFRRLNLHVVGYSAPVKATMSLSELRPHLHSLPDRPDFVPYRTSYYKEAWGFCLSHRQLESLPEGNYEVCIDSSFRDGSLTYAECLLPGRSADEVLISTHVCHPSLANDNLSGIAVAAQLASLLGRAERRLSYRFVFIPTTIGSIAWLSRNEASVSRIKHGLTLALLGDPGKFHYKRSRRGDAPVDRAMAHALKHSGVPHQVLDFAPWGYDERQYCSPGFNLPVGCFTRTPNGQFPEYHTSGDDLDFIKPESLAGSLRACLEALAVLDGDGRYLNTNPKGEPRLGKRVAYQGYTGKAGGKAGLALEEFSLLWVLNYSDGGHSLLDIAERAGYPFGAIRSAADVLEGCGLLVPAGDPPGVRGLSTGVSPGGFP